MHLTRLIPMLPVKSIAASIEFYTKLGFAIERREDKWAWAMLRFDDCRLMLDQSINGHPDAPRQSVLYLYPDDITEYHRQVRAVGLDIPDLETTFYGMIEFRLDDPDGNRLWIGQSPANDS
jgi:catechol 2,3-dioxygenase-like lactoylglutathione lyase family enzyme